MIICELLMIDCGLYRRGLEWKYVNEWTTIMEESHTLDVIGVWKHFWSSVAHEVYFVKLSYICDLVHLQPTPPPPLNSTYPIYPKHFGHKSHIKWVDVCCTSMSRIYHGRCVFRKVVVYFRFSSSPGGHTQPHRGLSDLRRVLEYNFQGPMFIRAPTPKKENKQTNTMRAHTTSLWVKWPQKSTGKWVLP